MENWQEMDCEPPMSAKQREYEEWIDELQEYVDMVQRAFDEGDSDCTEIYLYQLKQHLKERPQP